MKGLGVDLSALARPDTFVDLSALRGPSRVSVVGVIKSEVFEVGG